MLLTEKSVLAGFRIGVDASGSRAQLSVLEPLVSKVTLSLSLLPALAKSKNKAQQIHCLSNMKQMGVGFILYSQDYDGELPPTAHLSLTPENIWINTLSPYVGDVDEINTFRFGITF